MPEIKKCQLKHVRLTFQIREEHPSALCVASCIFLNMKTNLHARYVNPALILDPNSRFSSALTEKILKFPELDTRGFAVFIY